MVKEHHEPCDISPCEDMDNKEKITSHQNSEGEAAPIIYVQKGFSSVFAFCAKLGDIDYNKMDLIKGMRFSTDEYFEITAVNDAYIKFIIKIKNSDIKNDEFILERGETKTFEYKSEREFSYSDGCDFLEEVMTSVTLSWK